MKKYYEQKASLFEKFRLYKKTEDYKEKRRSGKYDKPDEEKDNDYGLYADDDQDPKKYGKNVLYITKTE